MSTLMKCCAIVLSPPTQRCEWKLKIGSGDADFFCHLSRRGVNRNENIQRQIIMQPTVTSRAEVGIETYQTLCHQSPWYVTSRAKV